MILVWSQATPGKNLKKIDCRTTYRCATDSDRLALRGVVSADHAKRIRDKRGKERQLASCFLVNEVRNSQSDSHAGLLRQRDNVIGQTDIYFAKVNEINLRVTKQPFSVHCYWSRGPMADSPPQRDSLRPGGPG